MINTAIERTFPLAKAARLHASTRGEGSIHPATVHRWRSPGIRGIKLECLRIGGVWQTSAEALQRFFEKLTDEAQEPSVIAESTKMARPGTLGRTVMDHQAQVEEQLDSVLGVASPSPFRKQMGEKKPA